MTALVAVVGLAVLREGSEVVLFLYGILAGGASGSSLLVGGALGLAAGAAFTAFTYYGLVSIPPRHIFAVTTVLIALLAAGMAAQAVQYLDAAGVINVLSRQLWDSSPWLPQNGIVGRVLGTDIIALLEVRRRAKLQRLPLQRLIAAIGRRPRLVDLGFDVCRKREEGYRLGKDVADQGFVDAVI